MKLKNLLIIVLITLTCIPALIVSLLLYKSGFALSKESYTRNLAESISVQADYISQTIKDNMVIDSRFAYKALGLSFDNLLSAFQTYLESAEDKITVCFLLDKDGNSLYTMGEKAVLNTVHEQLPTLSGLRKQTVIEFDLGNQNYGLGIVTPVYDKGSYKGSLVSVYTKSFLFKIISSYYELADTSTYICRSDGDIISARGHTDNDLNTYIQPTLQSTTFTSDGIIDIQLGDRQARGYYKNIYNTPWQLVGLIDYAQITAFTNQFVWAYLLILIVVAVVDILLAVYFSQKVIKPINSLIQVMDGYPESLKAESLQDQKETGYVETRYLRTKFLNLMNTISLVQHNFEGIFQLYQSSAMDDTNIDIDVMGQTTQCNKASFEELMRDLVVPEGACVVERFTRCFCEKDQKLLMDLLETMRDHHLAVAREVEVFTPHFGQKWFHVLVVPMYEQERLSRLFVQLRDVSSFKRQEQESLNQAERDPLTGLYNRTGFAHSAEHAMRENTDPAGHGLLFLDMNDFKLVNDNFGHSTGDQLLCDVGRVMLDTVGDEGIVARFGGDEFAVFLPYTPEARVLAVREALNERLVFPFRSDEASFVITASIGFSILNSSSSAALEERMKEADTDMYTVKRERKRSSR